MKNLSNYIKSDKSSLISLSEKLLIFHPQIDEKLIINKNTKIVNGNEDFYKKFKDKLKKFFTTNVWWEKNIDSICNILVNDKDAIPYLKEFFGDDSLNFRYVNRHYDIPMWKNILNFIMFNDAMEFVYSNSIKHDNNEYVLYLFETEEIKIFIWGWTKIKPQQLGHIAYQKKQ